MRRFLLIAFAVALTVAISGGGQYVTADILKKPLPPGFENKLLLPPADLRGKQFYLVEGNCVPFLMVQGEDLKSGDFSGTYYDPATRKRVHVRGTIFRPNRGVYRITFRSVGFYRVPLTFVGTIVDLSYEVDISGTLQTHAGRRLVRASTTCIH
jgi:hypothetical protein